jgi:hypothetical protein
MTSKRDKPKEEKISPEFVARLDHLGPREKVRAIVLFHTGAAGRSSGGRQSRAEREAKVEALRQVAKEALQDVDDILTRYDGQRLARGPDALGSLPVETTAAGIKALTSSEWVKAVLEDQDIHLIP